MISKADPDAMLLPDEETDADRLGGLLAHDALSLDLVSAFAGDRRLVEAEKALLERLNAELGDRFFSDLLYAVTHQYFPPEVARGLWNEIIRHKQEMSMALGRNIRIAVATLDFLSNLTTGLRSATVIGEAHIADIVRFSLRDGLTGLFNHACFYQKMDAEMRRYVRYNTTVSLMMIDVDDFKSFNDRHGHQEGDKILATIGAVIEKVTRDSDISCRYGGEEFAVILPSTEAVETAMLSERLRAKLEESLPGGRKVTVSIGVATCGRDAETSRALVNKADLALYQAKKNGKNQVVRSA